ncbi:WD40/YVTN/BNR-like repeat-containing protein [Rheinheimera soli]|uniref:WD40/YVTN/BNR-like repeat-containing protein n=1 Tax=Rheinheimera soli TaxID=443616 RepID=UPI001E466B5D|nr:YCF48-related protein [Rheinheimera soli]
MMVKLLSSVAALLLTTPIHAESAVAPTPSYMMPLAEKSVLTDLIRVNDELYVAVGDRGHLLLSKDSTHWTQIQTPVQSLFTSVYFSDDKHGWAVGHDATIIATQDGGQSWQLQQFKPETDKPLFDILFADASNGIALGAYGMFYRTTDGGKTWSDEFHLELVGAEDQEYLKELQETDPDAYLDERASVLPHFNRIYQHNNVLYLIGEAGFFATSADFGKSWTRHPEFYNGSLFGLAMTAKNTLIAAGLRGNVFRSTDLGQNWQEVQHNQTATLNSVLTDAADHVYLTGNAGTLLVSRDDGVSFEPLKTEDSKAILNAVAVKEQLVLVTEAGIRTLAIKKPE